MKKTSILFVSICLILCSLPFLGMTVYRTETTTENKTLAAFPKLTEKGKFNQEFPDQLSDYFEDHFAFRNELVTADANIQSRIFQVSNVDTVVDGRNGWLYYTDTVADYLRSEAFTPRQVFEITHNLALTQEYAENRGVKFVFTVPPNKNTLYGENMPYYFQRKFDAGRNADLVAKGLEAQGVRYADLFAPFRASKETLYLERDSHWNNKGAVLAYNTILNKLTLAHDTFEEYPRIRRKDAVGDLNKMLYPKGQKPEWDYHYQIPFSWEYTTPQKDVEAAYIETKNPKGKGNVLIFRDSFGNTLLPFFAQNFKDAAFSKEVPYDFASLIGKRKPDLVICEKVERNLDEFMNEPPILPAPEREIEVSQASSSKLSDVSISVCEENPDYYLISGPAGGKIAEEDSIYLTLGDEVSKTYEAYGVVRGKSDDGFKMYIRRKTLESEGLVRDGKLKAVVSAGQNGRAKTLCAGTLAVPAETGEEG